MRKVIAIVGTLALCLYGAKFTMSPAEWSVYTSLIGM